MTNTICATFSNKIFTTRNGEERLYINGIKGVKIWVVADENGDPEVRYKKEWLDSFYKNDAYDALDNAMKNLGVLLNATFEDIVSVATA